MMVIITDRLFLRPFRETDYYDVFEYQKEPLVNCLLSLFLSTAYKNTVIYLQMNIERKGKEK